MCLEISYQVYRSRESPPSDEVGGGKGNLAVLTQSFLSGGRSSIGNLTALSVAAGDFAGSLHSVCCS